ncbi:Cysteine/Histidine-rich C1 domain family protein [Hirschfeldia incana]|nr:Cysteine/Histidine-rich C1 domain family protein [Hirschfeldia incana]
MIRSKSIAINSNSTNNSAVAAAAVAIRRSASNATAATAVVHTNDLNRKPPRSRFVEFPVSPQLMRGEEMVHFGHPRHVLVKVELPDIYTCAGCKEEGAGIRYVCQECDYQLHEFCASAPPVLKSHPFHYQHQLLFFAKPAKGGIKKSKCDVCGRSPKGYTFRCKACSFQMHPGCAMLSPSLSSSSLHHHPLQLLSSSASNNTGGDHSGGFLCGECKRGKRVGRVYRCTVCDYHLHAVCAKDAAVNGLRANGHKGRDRSPAVLGTAARVASQVVIDFLGGIMEGLGEGVGEAILDGVTRGGGGGGRGGGNGGVTRVIPRVRGG